MKRLLMTLLLAALPAGLLRSETMILKHDIAVGAQFAYLKLDSDNSELFQLVKPLSAKASVSHITPFFEYAYKDDCTVGAKLQFLAGNLAIDNMTLDLMTEGLSFSVSDIDTHLNRFSATVYHRNYFALDKRSRIGIIAEESLSYSNTKASNSRGNKITLAFSPGIMFFVMNNISVSFSLSMANLSYNSVKSYKGDEQTGSHKKFGAKFGVDVTGINFEIGFHF